MASPVEGANHGMRFRVEVKPTPTYQVFSFHPSKPNIGQHES
jgi:hypothetical protein